MAILVAALAAGCGSTGGAGATSGGTTGAQQTDGGVRPGETCGTAATCGTSSQTYQLCMASGATCSARYLTGDGKSFACTSCTDCQSAAQMVTSWCGGATTGGGGGDSACANKSTQSACADCCTAAHSTGLNTYNSNLQDCECNFPGDCVFECDTSFCNDPTTTTSSCDNCMQSNLGPGDDCDQSTLCGGDSDCDALITCVGNCPP
jgi:hypothetical protein